MRDRNESIIRSTQEKKKRDEMTGRRVHIAIHHYSTDQCIWLIE